MTAPNPATPTPPEPSPSAPGPPALDVRELSLRFGAVQALAGWLRRSSATRPATASPRCSCTTRRTRPQRPRWACHWPSWPPWRQRAALADLGFVCLLHMKRSMHEAVLQALGLPPERTIYLEDTGHMSGVDTLLALDRAARRGLLKPGELVLLLAAGTGYTWAATTLRWHA